MVQMDFLAANHVSIVVRIETGSSFSHDC